MKRKMLGVFAALGIILGLLGMTAGPADAWLHQKSVSYTYKAPGPPPGPSGNHCTVTTKLWPSIYGDWASISSPGFCVAVCVQAVFVLNGYLINGEYNCERLDDGNNDNSAISGWVTSPTPPGATIFGANYQAYSSTLLDQWQVSILG